MEKRFTPIPKKEHKPIRHDREITAQRLAYKPKLRKLSTIKKAKTKPHKRTFFLQKRRAVPKSPYRYKYKPEFNISGRFILLLVILLVLTGGFVALLLYLIK